MNHTAIHRSSFLLASLVVLVTTAATTTASAQWPKQCRADVSRICGAVATQDDRTILSCLQDNNAKLSQACRKLLQSYGHVPDTSPKRR